MQANRNRRSPSGTIARATTHNKVPFCGIFAAFNNAKEDRCARIEDANVVDDPRIPAIASIGRDKSYEDYPVGGVFPTSELALPESRIGSKQVHKQERASTSTSTTMEEVEDEEDPRTPSIHVIDRDTCYR